MSGGGPPASWGDLPAKLLFGAIVALIVVLPLACAFGGLK